MDRNTTKDKPATRAAEKLRTWRLPPWAVQLLELLIRAAIERLR